MPPETFVVSRFRHKGDNEPVHETWSLAQMELAMTTFASRGGKNGPLWSPARFRVGGIRCLDDVVEVCALVLDFDDGLDHEDLVDHWKGLGYGFFVHSSFSHTPEHPKWRAVFPLQSPVPAIEWEETYAGLVRLLADGLTDPSCKDSSRMYFLPASRPGAARISVSWIDGRPLRADEALPYVPDPAAEPPKPTPRPRPEGVESPGDWFERTADWADILRDAGGTFDRRAGRRLYWIRPGKKPDGSPSATTGNGRSGQDLLKVLTCNWPPFEPGEVMTKYGAYTLIHHGRNNWTAAIAAIKQMPGFPKDEGGSIRKGPDLPPGPALDASKDPLAGMGYEPPKAAVQTSATVLDEPEPKDKYYDPRGFWRKFESGDIGNAERFVHYFGKDVRYVAGQGWFVWCDGRWRRNDEGEIAVKRLGMRVADRVAKAGFDEPEDSEARKKLLALGGALTNQRAIGPMLSLAAAFPQVEARAEDFDRDPYLLGVRNGVVDLRTGELLPPDPAHMITMRAGCDFERRECPTFLAFVEQIMLGREDLMRFLTVSLGYSLSGCTSTRAFWFLTGTGGNGKGVLTKLIQRILADYSTTLQPESIMVRRNEQIPADLAKLQGKRFVAVPEVNDEKRLNTALIKQLSGFDEITARFLNQNFIEFIPCAKIWMSGNQRPQVGNFDHALRTRLRVVPFELDVPVAEQDGDLGDKLWAEAPGILWFLVQAYGEYRRSNLPVVAEVEEATDAYQASTDTVMSFIDEECDVTDKTHKSPCKFIFQRYLTWCKESGVRGMGKQKFYARIKQLGFEKLEQAIHGNDAFVGIYLKGAADE